MGVNVASRCLDSKMIFCVYVTDQPPIIAVQLLTIFTGVGRLSQFGCLEWFGEVFDTD